MPPRLQALFAMSPEHLPLLFPPPVMARLTGLVDIDPGLVVSSFEAGGVAGADAAATLAGADLLITGWGCPPLDADTLLAAPRLTTVVHAAGSVKHLATPAALARSLTFSCAADANAVPVAEYTVGAILLAGKGVFSLRERYSRTREFVIGRVEPEVGNYGRRVGIVGASRIGRRVIELLRPHDFDLCLYDPYAQVGGVRQVAFADLLDSCDVVSLHAPLTAETTGMVGAAELARMRDGSVLINTARGELVDTGALAEELKTGRLSAILDVTHPEPLPTDSILFDLPNVFLTPHIAGSQGNELARLGIAAVDEVERLSTGRPLAFPVDLETLGRIA
ncbi:MAG: hydroxyacid dehydrogenase [Streptomyces sp.]|uniref:hydroxyacid dehydrogenase n=1 Tax=Streptomyces sp. TaxID=1931 RepID=UPI0025EBD6A0|nr:hydroxyacid dehydrogenase [Streptomyces sp.]MBW8799894.1 hydroxyacid dehydrogenase [Streptomyces sp.]